MREDHDLVPFVPSVGCSWLMCLPEYARCTLPSESVVFHFFFIFIIIKEGQEQNRTHGVELVTLRASDEEKNIVAKGI